MFLQLLVQAREELMFLQFLVQDSRGLMFLHILQACEGSEILDLGGGRNFNGLRGHLIVRA